MIECHLMITSEPRLEKANQGIEVAKKEAEEMRGDKKWIGWNKKPFKAATDEKSVILSRRAKVWPVEKVSKQVLY